MRRATILALAATAALLASCGKPVTCNYDGEVIIPEGANLDDKIKWMGENSALTARRADVLTGNLAASRNHTKESLEKADSCP